MGKAARLLCGTPVCQPPLCFLKGRSQGHKVQALGSFSASGQTQKLSTVADMAHGTRPEGWGAAMFGVWNLLG